MHSQKMSPVEHEWLLDEQNILPCGQKNLGDLITSPGWMQETSAQGWCTGKTQRDGIGREAGGGSGWGTHGNPWLIHVNV